jgi:hypothetical protein
MGNTVDVKEATYNNSIGAPTLDGYWKDPAFDVTPPTCSYVEANLPPTKPLTSNP